MKKYCLFYIFVFFVLSCSGCNTVKGTAEGLKEDTNIAWEKLMQADQTLREKAW